MKAYRTEGPAHAPDMFEHFPERRRYIRSRADLEFQLARITLALSRAPIARQPELRDWFDDATAGLLARAAPEHREYVEERIGSIRETFFGAPAASPEALRGMRRGTVGGMRPGGSGRMH